MFADVLVLLLCCRVALLCDVLLSCCSVVMLSCCRVVLVWFVLICLCCVVDVLWYCDGVGVLLCCCVVVLLCCFVVSMS